MRLFVYTSVDERVENEIGVRSPAGCNITGLTLSSLFIPTTPHLLKTQNPQQIIPLSVDQVYKHKGLRGACYNQTTVQMNKITFVLLM